jgi:hydrogenase-1 operon protein HyaF
MTDGLTPDAVRAVLVWLRDALHGHVRGAAARGLDVGHLTGSEQAALAEVLGEGEVAVNGAVAGTIRETRFPGVWCHLDGDGVHAVRLEVGEQPTLAMAENPTHPAALRLATPPEDLMNGPAVLAEIEQQQAAYRPGGEAHTVNLSRLPITPGDRDFLAERLGEGDPKIRVRGYGETRIRAAKRANVWWVRHYNASEQLLLDTVEVGDFPSVARAAPEDLADSAARLRDLLGET